MNWNLCKNSVEHKSSRCFARCCASRKTAKVLKHCIFINETNSATHFSRWFPKKMSGIRLGALVAVVVMTGQVAGGLFKCCQDDEFFDVSSRFESLALSIVWHRENYSDNFIYGFMATCHRVLYATS